MVIAKPQFKQVVRNFRTRDYQTIAVTTILSMPFGYFAGTARLPQMRGPSMWTAAAIGLTGGFAIAYQAPPAPSAPATAQKPADGAALVPRSAVRTGSGQGGDTRRAGGHASGCRLMGFFPNYEEVREARRG